MAGIVSGRLQDILRHRTCALALCLALASGLRGESILRPEFWDYQLAEWNEMSSATLVLKAAALDWAAEEGDAEFLAQLLSRDGRDAALESVRNAETISVVKWHATWLLIDADNPVIGALPMFEYYRRRSLAAPSNSLLHSLYGAGLRRIADRGMPYRRLEEPLLSLFPQKLDTPPTEERLAVARELAQDTSGTMQLEISNEFWFALIYLLHHTGEASLLPELPFVNPVFIGYADLAVGLDTRSAKAADVLAYWIGRGGFAQDLDEDLLRGIALNLKDPLAVIVMRDSTSAQMTRVMLHQNPGRFNRYIPELCRGLARSPFLTPEQRIDLSAHLKALCFGAALLEAPPRGN